MLRYDKKHDIQLIRIENLCLYKGKKCSCISIYGGDIVLIEKV